MDHGFEVVQANPACFCGSFYETARMNGKTIVCLAALVPVVLSGCAGTSGDTRRGAMAGVETNNVVATDTEQSLLSALNAERRAAGRGQLAVSPVLARLARSESDSAAAAARIPGNTTPTLRMKSGFNSVGKLQGTLKDRGTPTGKSFVEYWTKSSREVMLDDWSKVGVGVSRAADGRLFAIVVLGATGGGHSGGALMNPAISPSGF